jgi:glycosyltransferase involved in cell wall biosynthesis
MSAPAGAGERVVLFVAYFFPPLGGGGVQRTVKFVKYLRQHGWRSEVVTVRAQEYWVADRSLAADVPAETRVWRTRSLTGLTLLDRLRRRAPGGAAGGGETVGGEAGQPAVGGGAATGGATRSSGLFGLLRGLSSFFLIPDSYAGWLPFALRAVDRRLAAGGIDVLITTSSPDTAHLVGMLAGRRHPVRWVADFRDPWVNRITFRAPTPLHRWLHTRLERRVLERADRVLVTNDATRDDFLARHPSVPAARFAVIPNGFDPEDVTPAGGAAAEPAAAEPAAAEPAVAEPAAGRGRRARLELLHAGLLSGRRTLAPITAALAQLFAQKAEVRGRLRLTQLGPRERINDRLVDEHGLGDTVVFAPPVDHPTVLGAMRDADALLLVEVGDERGALITPGKIFEYLASRRPILAVVPEGPAAALVREMGAGVVVAPGEPRRIAQVLADWLEAGPPASRVTDAALAPYARPALAARLAAVLDELAGR